DYIPDGPARGPFPRRLAHVGLPTALGRRLQSAPPSLRTGGFMMLLAARGESPASHRGRRGAPLTRRDDDREYREYLREEQRGQRGCIAARTGSPTRQPRWGPRM